MNCDELREKYEGDFENKEFQEHIEKCESCKRYYETELILRKGAKRIRARRVPKSVWAGIEKSLEAEIAKKRSRRGVFFGWLSGFDIQVFVKPAIAFGMIIILSLVSYRLFFPGDNNRQELQRLQTEAVSDINEAQKYYLSAIQKLTVLADANKENIEPKLLAMYKEKLALIDESITECRQILEENIFNVNAQRFLFTAYQKKIDTLQEMADYGKSG